MLLRNHYVFSPTVVLLLRRDKLLILKFLRTFLYAIICTRHTLRVVREVS